ncbi:ATP-binding protein [Spirillospora sp. NPDC048911]|uniref:ATP-binding protein n=1 Tax=Spirillospora sp. NPDC048911 TaxID=3364527 RepID=UPI0037115499
MSTAMVFAAGPVPLFWRRSFPGVPEQARTVRRFAACLLDGCPYLDDVLLAADELVVNAIRHTKSGEGGTFTVEVMRGANGVAVSVADQGGPGGVVVRDAGELDESGRGLKTVASIAASWSWHGNEDGRTVTAVFVGEWL